MECWIGADNDLVTIIAQ